MNTPYLLLLVAVFWVTIVVSQKNPPPLPTEYYCNVIQRKWNHNGYGVNHTESSTSYSSYSLGYYRFDTAAIESNFTATSGNVGNLASSLNDYTGKVFPTPIDTFVEISNVGQVPTCTVYNSTWPPPLPANGLSLLGAIYSGTREIPYYGQVDQWTVVENKAAATFWFSGGLIVGYQFDANNSDQGQVGVVTFMFNLVEGTFSEFL